MTLVELLVSLAIVAVLAVMVTGLLVRSHTTQQNIERTDEAQKLSKAILTAAQSTSYANLGYYDNDPGFAAGTVTLPLADGTGQQTTSATQIRLGTSRPDGQAAFAPATGTATVKGTDYKTQVWVTETTGGAKRVTVQGMWPADGASCTSKGVHCITQTLVRAPWSSDESPSGVTAPPQCAQATPGICQTFVRSGRVLDGESFASTTTYPRQSGDVLLAVRTTKPATAVTATWTWTGLDGSTTAVTIPAAGVQFHTVEDNATIWQATIPADPADAASPAQFKKWVRPGTVTVTFTATIDGAQVSAARDARWTYTSAVPITAKVTGTPGSCNVSTTGSPTTISVSGLSLGFGANTSQSAADTVDATYTVTQGGQVTTVTAPATLVDRTEVYQYDSGRVVGGHVDADFTVASPPNEACPNTSSDGVITVHRTTDGTDTPFRLQLTPAATVDPGLPTTPVPAIALSQTTGSANITWPTQANAVAYQLRYQLNSGAWTTVDTTDTTLAYPGTVNSGATLGAQARSQDSFGRWSAWSSTAQATRIPTVPTLTLSASSATLVQATWTASDGATSYTTQYRVNAGSWVTESTTSTGKTITVTPGQSVDMCVAALNGGGTSGWSSCQSVTTPPATPGPLTLVRVYGRTAIVSWSPVPGATSYSVTGGNSTIATATTSASIPVSALSATLKLNGINSAGTSTGPALALAMPSSSVLIGYSFVRGSTPTPGDLAGTLDNRDGTSLVSPNGRYVAIWQGDGNFVTYDLTLGKAGHATDTYGGAVGVGVGFGFQGDGNLVMYGAGNVPLKYTDTYGKGAYQLQIQDDGNLVIYNGSWAPIWALSWGAGNPGAGANFMVAK